MTDFERECEQLIESLPKETWLGCNLVQHQGFWYPKIVFPGIISCQRNFQALATDIFLATKPKCGTTWLKALVFAIANRHRYPELEDHPLCKSNPHHLVPFVEMDIDDPCVDLSPRIFGTHLAFESLPESVEHAGCRIIYMCRNPVDAFASSWHFFLALARQHTSANSDHIYDGGDDDDLQGSFEKFCQGVDPCGPFLDHALGYWKASRERPDQVLFLDYDNVKHEPAIFVKRIAEFLGVSFSSEEESDGRVEEITGLCSFKSLRDAEETNKHGSYKTKFMQVDTNLYFRKAEVGDWVNLLNPSMVKRFDDIMKDKLEGSGLAFRISTP